MAAGGNGARHQRALGIWLLCVAFLVFAMVMLGGATRLTNSGLSMVEWRPLMGVLPPLTDSAWQETFDKYRQFPEYQKINRGMELSEFKRIFYFEYAHRMLGRGIGLAFAIPFLVFLALRRIAWRQLPVLVGLFVLGGLQGVIGWWMVKSGLIDRPDVSHYRLTVHLGLAVAIFAALLWVAFDFLWGSGRRVMSVFGVGVLGFGGLVFLQVLLGGLVAGLNAGLVYNTWPTMNGAWLPPDLITLSPAWLNLFENPVMVQFVHRLGAYALVVVAVVLWWRSRTIRLGPQARIALYAVLATLAVQVGLGIATLLAMVPVTLGVVHQGGALVVLACLVLFLHRLRGEEVPDG